MFLYYLLSTGATLNGFESFLLVTSPGLSKKSAYRLNVTLKASETGTVITKKIFRFHKPYILSQKAIKAALISGVILNAYQQAPKPLLRSAKLPSPEMSLN